MDTIEKIKEYFLNDKYAMSLGFNIESGEPGKSIVKVELNENLLNGVGIPHGGLIYSLCDFSGAVATNAHGFVSLSIDCSITYLNQAKGKFLIAKAKEINRSRRISHITMDVYDELDTYIATAKGTYYITEKEILI